MYIQDHFNVVNTGESLYSVILDEDELKLFTKMEDQDYILHYEKQKKDAKHTPLWLGLPFGAMGAMSGAATGSGKAAAAGAAIGGGLGYLGGRIIKKRVNKDSDEKINKYKKASEADKKYLRRQLEKEKDREAMMTRYYY